MKLPRPRRGVASAGPGAVLAVVGALLCCDPVASMGQTTRPGGAASLPADRAGDAALLKQLGSDFLDYRAAHFTIISDADPQRVARLSRTAEDTLADVAAFSEKLGLALQIPAVKMTVVFFEQWTDYQRHARQAGFHVDESVPGFFDDRSNRCLMFDYANATVIRKKRDELRAALREQLQVQHTDRDKAAEALLENKRRHVREIERQIEAHQRLISRTVVRHEIAHQVLLNFGLQPRGATDLRWLREGLAMQFEGRQKVNRHRLEDFLATAHQGIHLNLRQLVGDPKHIGPGASNLTSRYARAWVLVHYLVHEQPEKFAAFLQARVRDRQRRAPTGTALATFEASFGKLDGALEKRLWEYAQGLARALKP